MSRYKITHDRYDIAVGWDRSLETFFAIATDTADADSEEVSLWLGTSPKEFPEIGLFIAAFAKEIQRSAISISIPDAMLTQLECDRTFEGYGLGERPAPIRRFLTRDQ